MSTAYEEAEYGVNGDSTISDAMWANIHIEGEEGFGWGEHWIWVGIQAPPKQVAKCPVHTPFMVLHPAYHHGARQFVRQCDEWLCVNPRHYEPRAQKYRRKPPSPWEGVDVTLPAWYTEGTDR